MTTFRLFWVIVQPFPGLGSYSWAELGPTGPTSPCLHYCPSQVTVNSTETMRRDPRSVSPREIDPLFVPSLPREGWVIAHHPGWGTYIRWLNRCLGPCLSVKSLSLRSIFFNIHGCVCVLQLSIISWKNVGLLPGATSNEVNDQLLSSNLVGQNCAGGSTWQLRDGYAGRCRHVGVVPVQYSVVAAFVFLGGKGWRDSPTSLPGVARHAPHVHRAGWDVFVTLMVESLHGYSLLYSISTAVICYCAVVYVK